MMLCYKVKTSKLQIFLDSLKDIVDTLVMRFTPLKCKIAWFRVHCGPDSDALMGTPPRLTVSQMNSWSKTPVAFLQSFRENDALSSL